MIYNYVIIEESAVTPQQWADNLMSADSARRSVAGPTKVLLKWTGDTPASFNGLTVYTREEIIAEMKKSDWRLDPDA